MSLSLRQPPLNILKESLVDPPKPTRTFECLKISGRRPPVYPADGRVLTAAGEFSDKLVEIGEDELVAE
jgi:hypothetical protein